MAMTQNEGINNLTNVVERQRTDIDSMTLLLNEVSDKLEDDKLLKIGGKLAAGEGAGGSIQVNTQGIGATAIGVQAGNSGQSQYAVALGYEAGFTNQGMNSIAVGTGAGKTEQPDNSIVIGYQTNVDNEGDIVLETLNTTNNNNNKLEVKNGILYINGVDISDVAQKSWVKITDFWTSNSKYDDIDIRVINGNKIFNLTSIDKGNEFTFGGSFISGDGAKVTLSSADKITMYENSAAEAPVDVSDTIYIEARIGA